MVNISIQVQNNPDDLFVRECGNAITKDINNEHDEINTEVGGR